MAMAVLCNWRFAGRLERFSAARSDKWQSAARVNRECGARVQCSLLSLFASDMTCSGGRKLDAVERTRMCDGERSNGTERNQCYMFAENGKGRIACVSFERRGGGGD